MGNIAAERGEAAAAGAAAEGHHRTSARLFEILHDLPAVASQLSAVGQMLLLQDRLEQALEEFRAAARGEILADIGDARQATLDLDPVPLQESPAARAARCFAPAKLGDRSRASREVDEIIAEVSRNGDVLLHPSRVKAPSDWLGIPAYPRTHHRRS